MQIKIIVTGWNCEDYVEKCYKSLMNQTNKDFDFVFVDDAKIWDSQTVHFIRVPTCGKWIAPIIYTIPLQLLAYHVAVAKGTDIDQTRNLAKSVTVE